MGKVNVLVISRLDFYRNYLDDIAKVDPEISIKDGLKQFATELRRENSASPYLSRMESQIGQVSYDRVPEATEDLDTLLGEAEVIFGTAIFPTNLLRRAPGLRWVHIGSVGIDRYLSTDWIRSPIIVTNTRGATAIPIAEHALGFVFMLAKKAPRLLANKQERRWQRLVTTELRDRVMGIVGLGAIGSEVARLARGIGMKVIATRRSSTKREVNVMGVDEVYPATEIHHLLRESDFVVLAAPLTQQTRGLIGEAELQMMKPTACLINIARGPIVNQAALIKGIKAGWIAGAGLDVFEKEPLPPDSELWQLPNVILSPHMATSSDRRSQRIVALFGENLRRYLAGKPLINVIDLNKGY